VQCSSDSCQLGQKDTISIGLVGEGYPSLRPTFLGDRHRTSALKKSLLIHYYGVLCAKKTENNVFICVKKEGVRWIVI
jgi:hypothetical protein